MYYSVALFFLTYSNIPIPKAISIIPITSNNIDLELKVSGTSTSKSFSITTSVIDPSSFTSNSQSIKYALFPLYEKCTESIGKSQDKSTPLGVPSPLYARLHANIKSPSSSIAAPARAAYTIGSCASAVTTASFAAFSCISNS